jgi:hypothetical protein
MYTPEEDVLSFAIYPPSPFIFMGNFFIGVGFLSLTKERSFCTGPGPRFMLRR